MQEKHTAAHGWDLVHTQVLCAVSLAACLGCVLPRSSEVRMGAGLAALLAVELVVADAVLGHQVAPAEVVLTRQVYRVVVDWWRGGGVEGWRW